MANDPLLTLEIERLTHEGRGVAHLNGKTVFVTGALPGEQVLARRVRKHRRYEEAVTVEVQRAAEIRVAEQCAHAAVCGGCSLQHMPADEQIRFKQSVLADLFQHQAHIQPARWLAPLTGPAFGYRRRMRLAAKHVEAKGGVLVGFREKGGRYLTDMHACPVLAAPMGELIQPLRDLLGGLSIAGQIPQLEAAVADNAVALVVRHLADLSHSDVASLQAFGQLHAIDIWLQPGGPATIHPLSGDARTLSYEVDGITLEFSPVDFTQVNNDINRQMVAQAMALLDAGPDDHVLDLFCGLGNFSLPLARRARFVTGIEGDAGLVALATRNAANNGITNAAFKVADLTKDMSAVPADISRVLLDPPRSGALEALQAMNLHGVDRVVYVSCNPMTLARDSEVLVKQHGYRLTAAGVMDMFPHTAHVESMALFER
ncbi:MAG: 23S rRNA (uracil(1939)-C(5))-methyltransferase RlmD [Gammaproteobacteria bacterium]|nr:23S rRNA (uracil(1939)-C(5))-methyltransferase RlmD [Gammaproteobacteria bacterium]